jgi:hypothetical protein
MAYHEEDFVRAVESIYPGQIKSRVDFLAVNNSDGNGPFIAEWLRADLVQPTQAQIEAVDTDALPPPPVVHDPNVRIDAGIAAAVTTVIAAATAIHAIPHSGAVPARFEALLVQMNVLADAFVAMLQAQQNPP